MAGTLTVQNIQGPASGANANKIIIPSGQTLDASAGFVPPAGSVVQVKQAIKADRQTISTTTWTDISGLSVNITPTSASNKILVRLAVNGAGNNNCYVTLVSSQHANMIGTVISEAGATSGNRNPSLHDYYWGGISWGGLAVYSAVEVLDSPQTTSELTYSAKGFTASGSDAFYINQSKDGEDSSSRAALISTLTVMEIAG